MHKKKLSVFDDKKIKNLRLKRYLSDTKRADASSAVGISVCKIMYKQSKQFNDFINDTYIDNSFIITPSLDDKNIKPVMYTPNDIVDVGNLLAKGILAREEELTHYYGEELKKVKVPRIYFEVLKSLFYEMAIIVKGQETE